MRRRFNGSESAALFVAAGGFCQGCGAELGRGWHADHKTPYVAGGPTDVSNGQALCPTCNLRKGDRLSTQVPMWPKGIGLRLWQQRAWAAFLCREKADFTVIATPGAGKTVFALRCAHGMLVEETAERVIIVCPTEHLKFQWEEEAKRVGLLLDPKLINRNGLASDYHGACVTYQQVAAEPSFHRTLTQQRPTVVIFDEIHHAGDNLTWGSRIRHAHENAVCRLLMSGTLFRSDNSPIPFVSYENNKSIADYSYQYGDALRDGVCRPVLFPSYEGNMDWWYNGEVFSARFKDDLSQVDASRRLRTALECSGKWLPEIIGEADKKLTAVRANGHPDAGGLILAIDITHAKSIARLVQGACGETPAIAVSDDPAASDVITAFANGRQRWIIAVKMVSEGVDIKRLRVGVYATNILTELFFRQAVGRFVRMIGSLEEESAYLFIPCDPTLIALAEAIKEERDHELREATPNGEPPTGPTEEPLRKPWLPGDASKAEPDDVIYDGQGFSPAEIAEARGLAEECGLGLLPEAKVALFMRQMAARLRFPTAPPPLQPEGPAPSPEKTLRAQKEMQRKRIRRIVSQLVEATGVDYQVWFGRLMRLDNVSQTEATMEQLQEREKVLLRWLDLVQRGNEPTDP